MAKRIKNPEIQRRKEELANAKNKLLPQFSEKEMKAIAQAARTDFATYATLVGHIMQKDYQLFDVHNEIADVLQDFYDNAKIGVNLNCPPRLGKSSIVILFTSWYLGKNPHHNIGFITHTIDLSTKHNEKVRRIVKSPLFKLIFPNCVISKSSDSKTRFVTTKGGSVSTYGRSGNYSGETFQLIVLDDLVKGVEEIFSEATRETLRSVFDNIIQRIQTGTHKQGTEATQFLSIGTRYYADDILSKFETLFLDNGGGSVSYPVIANSNIISYKTGEVIWEEGNLICPELVGEQTVSMVKSSMTPDVYRALYLCEPLSDTNFFKKEWINYISVEELKTKKTRNFLAVDAALTVSSTSDETGFTIGMIDNEGKVYIKSWGEKLEPKDLMEKIFWLHDKYKFEKIGMEKMMYTTGVKPFMEDEMRRRNRFMPIELISHGNKAKEARVVGALPALYSSGTYWHIEGQCDKLETQMFNFPKGRLDDVIDSCALLSEVLVTEKYNADDYGVTTQTGILPRTNNMY